MSILIPKPLRWKPLSRDGFGAMNILSDMVQRACEREPEFLPDLHRGPTIFIASDYSGEHDTAQFQTLCFLFADLAGCGPWESSRKTVRSKWLSDKRRMSYKELGDEQREAALFSFLSAADSIPGLSVSVLIDRKIESLFRVQGPLDQDVVWITDDDAIAPNASRVAEVTKLFVNISSHYLDHDLRHFRFGTAATTDDGSRSIEDLVSVPDLIAGALAHTATSLRRHGLFPASRLVIPIPSTLAPKTQRIMQWFVDKSKPLKRVVYSIEPIENRQIEMKHINLHAFEHGAFTG